MSRNNENRDLKFEFDSSWILLAILTFAVPPLGVFLLIKKYSETRARANRTRNYKPLFSGGVLLGVIGTIVGELGGVIMAITGGVMALTSLLSHHRQQHEGTRLENTYLTIIGDRDSVTIRELAKVTNRGKRTVMKDLEKMLEDNLLPKTAYIDHAAKALVMRRAKDEPIVAEVAEPEKAPQPKTAPKSEPAAQQDAADHEAAVLHETFDAKLREIRYWNEEIDDERVSARIDDIEATTANIFYIVRQKPERASEIRTFMNYYLPTTLKLLKAYALLEKQNAAGQNIRNSRQEIEAILDKLAEGFRQQLDKLFQADAIDISSDIDVLETMMAQDGLLRAVPADAWLSPSDRTGN